MKNFVITVLLAFMAFGATAQNDVILEINGKKITVDEFLYIYKKNNLSTDAMSYNALKDYMELFINFKLKVQDAIDMGLDTVTTFKKELNQYRNQIAQPYLNDHKIEEEILAEAYERMKYDVNTAHILIKIPKDASPEDTLKAYHKIHDIYNKLLKGQDFMALVKEYSEDKVSVEKYNGILGFRTVFNFYYEYETPMYNTPVGSFSQPFRTEAGYHILKVIDKRPAKGRYNIAHIMKVYPPDADNATKENVRKQILEIQKKLKAGENFAKIAEESSDDRRTASQGGVIGWITVSGKMIKEFEDAAFALENENDISPIIQTSYGYHIIKLMDKEPVQDFEKVKTNIKNQISNSARIHKSRSVVIERLKKDYNFTVTPDALKNFYPYVTDSIFEGSWKIEDKSKLNKQVFSFAGKTFTQNDFAKYLEKYNKKQGRKNIKSFVDECFQKFQDEELITYEESQLENKYPDFKYLYNEYRDGILLFELTDKKVWSKAGTDTEGLEKFYKENKSNYTWDYRYDVRTYKTKNNKITSELEKSFTKNPDDTKIINKLNKKDANSVVLENHVINEKNVTLAIDSLIKKYNIPEDSKFVKIIANPEKTNITVIKVLSPTTKELDEAKGRITADYHDYLEKQWVVELRNKYPVIIHDDVLRKISK